MFRRNASKENIGWSWDRETLVKAQGLLSTLTSFQHIISFVIAKNALHTLKGIAVKLHKKGRDIFEAYQMVDEDERLSETLLRKCV